TTFRGHTYPLQWKTLGEVAEIRRGVRVVRNDLQESGEIPVYQNSLTPLGYHNKHNFDGNTTFIIGAGAAGEIGFSQKAFWAADDCFPIVCGKSVTSKFVYHWLKNNQVLIKSWVRKASIPRLSREPIETMLIPIPPVELQEQIVEILDRFSALTTELQNELQDELAARREQYAYYRNRLLDFGRTNRAQWLPLEEVFEMKAGKAISSSNINSDQGENQYPCYGANGLRGYVATKNNCGPKILIGRQGALCGNVCYVGGDFYATDHAVVVSVGENNPRYMYHVLTHADLNQYKTAGAQPGLSVEILKKVIIPVPNLEEQERIASILDRLEAAYNDLMVSIPAEIAARREQYAYYRNRLLSFAE
ncbi:MAG: restriction endonuclease subunit S, partial [Prevotella sp.]|nr:restriction endonuclease subunit S [Prevotella sp.]